MNAKLSIPVVVLALALPALAQDTQTTPSISKTLDPESVMRANPYADPIDTIARPSTVKLGKSDYVITGPIVGGMTRRPIERPSLWKRIVSFPIYLVTPQPMGRPPEVAGPYFKWGSDSSQPWVTLAAGAPATKDSEDPAIVHETVPLVTIGR